ncbi:MAG: SIR2 family protein [Candidatus Desulfaltia sp.]|nr:SIR2 family protein [Candidatus Desulfaltia sp.]
MDEKSQQNSGAQNKEPKKSEASPNISIFSVNSSFHCPYRQAMLLTQALSSNKMKVAFLLGAGCPVSVRVSDGQNTRPLIPDIEGLSSHVCKSFEKNEELKSGFEMLIKRLSIKLDRSPNVEDILSFVRALQDVAGSDKIHGLSKDALEKFDTEICRIVTELVKVDLPGDSSPYHHLANWIRSVPRAHPVEIFTPNYDLLMEQALEKMKVPYFDGFVGSRHSFFDLTSMEQDSLPPRWARLWKVHGSINWWRTKTNEVERRTENAPGDSQMIYPSHLKYEQSRRMPYLAMLDRLRSFLIRGQAVLITCGYSFSDQHINDVILQALGGNPTAICFGLFFGDRANVSQEAILQIRSQPNFSLLAVDGSILGTTERQWCSDEKIDNPFHGLAVNTGAMKYRTDAPDTCCKFLLGDFSAFGDFLALQLSQFEGSGGGSDEK